MKARRFTLFVLVTIIVLAAVGITSPALLDRVKLGLDLKGGFEILYEATPMEEGQELTREVLREAARSLEHRANATGVAEPEVLPEGDNRIRVRIAGAADEGELRDVLKKPADLTFRSADGCTPEQGFCKKELIGTDFAEGGAEVQFDPTTNMPFVAIKLKGKEKFTEVTTRLSQSPNNILAIYLDDKEISTPAVSQPIPKDEAIITGDFTHKEATELANTINLGALPVKLTEKYTQSVGATLGKASLNDTILAGSIGTVIILLFMLFYYRVPGIVASITLIAYIWLLLLVFILLNATLTLPGIAAFVLGIGMAVDANIITYERIRDEIRSGKTILSSVRAGGRNSFRTIMDANVTTIIAGVALYFIGTGGVQGFAIILIASILVSVVTNVFLARILLNLLMRTQMVNKPSYFGVKESEINAL